MILGIVFGIIGLCIILGIEYITSLFHFSLFDLVWAYVIPLGSIAFGVLLGAFIYKAIKKSNIKYQFKVTVLSLIFGILIVPSIYGVRYATTYIDYDEEVNQDHRGNHISEYVYKGEPMNYFNYIRFIIENNSYTIRGRHTKSNVDLDVHPTLNIVVLLFQNIVAIFFCAMTVAGLLKSQYYCEHCKKYGKEKDDLFEFDDEYLPQLQADIDNSLARGVLPDLSYLKHEKPKYYSASLNYCPICNGGELLLNHKEIVKKKVTDLEKDDIKYPLHDYRIFYKG